MLDPQLLEAFAFGFFGYGNPDAPIWFVGLEESGGKTLEDAQRRMLTWARRGKRTFEDVADYHRELNDQTRFDSNPTIQPTWGKLIRLQLAFQGIRNVTVETVRDYQQTILGRENCNELLIELYPLPSPGKNIWRYNEFSPLRWLADRAAYQQYLFEYRTQSISKFIGGHRPAAVVFYCKTEKQSWQTIADTHFEENKELDILVSKKAKTVFVVSKHPVSVGVSNGYFEQIGTYLRSNP
ncbi:MAG: hypothetical protein EPO32_04690 [Anaerolineae bacterium]|nr:MAG: hypothetical protein EPO32_04690 [Anaerolineae bacterium]